MENQIPFGEDTFKEWFALNFPKSPNMISWGPTPIPLSLGSGASMYDHGFIVDCMPVFTGLNGNEMCIISRTYCRNETIDNPLPGIKHLRFPQVMCPTDRGQAIVTYITGPGEGADDFLRYCGNVRAKELPQLLPLRMCEEGWQLITAYSEDLGEGWANLKLVQGTPRYDYTLVDMLAQEGSTLNDVLDADEIASIASTRGITVEEAGRLQWTGDAD